MVNNNCDATTAKNELEKLYDIPTKKESNISQEDFDKELILLGIPEDIVQTHDQATIKEYADEKNIQLPNPPQQDNKR